MLNSENSDSSVKEEPYTDSTPNVPTPTSDQEQQLTVESDGEVQQTQLPPRTVNGISWVLVVFAMLGSTFLYALDGTIVADVGPHIITTLGGLEKMPWLGTAFTWAAMATILIWSKLYCLFDAKYLYLIGSIIFEVGSALCGGAPNINAMIAGRAIAGLGASGIYVGSLTLLSVNTTEQERPRYIGFTGLSWGSGFVLGPVIGGAFAESSATWRWAFYINLVLFGVFAPILIFLVPSYDPKSGTRCLERVKQIDWFGSIVELGATLAGIMAISFGGTVYPWNGGKTIGLFVASGVAFIVFFAQQYLKIFTTADNRIFPMQFLNNKHMILYWILIAAPAAAVLGPVYFIPIFFQFVHGDSPVDAAVRLLPIILTFVCFGLGGGFVVSKTGHFYPLYFTGGIFATVGAVLMFTDIDLSSDSGKLYGYSALIGIGGGAAGQLSYSAAQFRVDPKDIPATIGFICFGQYTGLTLALCISGALFNNFAQNYVTDLLPPGTPIDIIRAVIQGLDDSFLETQSAETRLLILEAVVEAIKKTYPVTIAAGCLMITATLFLDPRDRAVFK
ncbi:hypothetical protein ONS96_013319 [Cadophora gregata f. sp. sojae]|nr:hypothetical protein ONS96_013319 [Cadophora gregata f. sp. sojae]